MSILERAVGTSRVCSWLKELEENPQGYYEVELSDNDSGMYSPLMLSASYIASKDLDPSLEVFELAEQKLILDMYISGAIHRGESGAGCNWRLKVLGWYTSLPEEDKRKLPIFGNKLSLRRGLTLIPGLEGIQAHITRYSSVASAYDEINQDLQRLGVISSDYQTVKERRDSQEKYIPQEHKLVDFKRLRMTEFVTLADLEAASEGKPFNDLKHAFAIASLKTASDSGERNYLDAFNMVSRAFLERGLTGREPIGAVLDAFILPRIYSHLEQMIVRGEMSPSFATTLLSAFRKTLTTIKSLKGYAGPDFVNCQGFDADRVTDQYRPYTSSERQRIAACVDEDIMRNNVLAQPYQFSGVGEDPLGSNGKLKTGYGTLENARWIFENKLNCHVVGTRTRSRPSGNIYTDAFWSIVERSGENLRDILEGWGIHYLVDSRVIAPYAIKLGQITGLNADSLKYLNLDDFEPQHELTGRACLKYWKERSGGGKVMPVDLFDADITWLTTSQADAVAKVFKDVETLTAGFREAAPVKARNSLFIWQSSAPRDFLQVKSFATGKDGFVTAVFNSYAQRKGVLGDNGAPLNLTPARLRPSFISELVERGVPIREIQLILGHKHIKTTQAYLDRMDFNSIARAKLDLALRELHDRAVEAADLAIAPKRHEAQSANLIEVVQIDAPVVVFKTPLASCKNIFNPPDFIKRLSTYVPGRPCSMYNMCLGCENVLLTGSNLPELFAMERDYRKLAEVSRVMDTPYGHVVHENLSLLESILGDKSDFTAEELAEGRRLAEFVDTTILIDGVGL
ncbi:site-specific tyrosine recombinase XerC [compost metagenome]